MVSKFNSFLLLFDNLDLLTACEIFSLRSRSLLLQLLQPWNPAFGIKFSKNQFYVMFNHWDPPSRLRSFIKRDIMSRRSHTHFQSCNSIVAARGSHDSQHEDTWFKQAAAAVEDAMPHCVRSVFHNGCAYDLRMQRAVRRGSLF
jgi:hypothetical protein